MSETPLRIPHREEGLVSAAMLARRSHGLRIGGFLSPEEHNRSIRMRWGRYSPEDKRTWPLNREEVLRLYGEVAMLRLFPEP